jgi:hypothetical protein
VEGRERELERDRRREVKSERGEREEVRERERGKVEERGGERGVTTLAYTCLLSWFPHI